MYVQPLSTANPPIVPPQRLSAFLTDGFHNVGQLVHHHRRLLESLHAIQQDEHPLIHTITAAVLDAFLNFRDAYLDYIPNYPIAAYRIEDEKANNPRFKEFHDVCLRIFGFLQTIDLRTQQAVRHPDANRQDMKSFVNRPIPRLLRYQLLMESVLKETPEGHEDRHAIPQLLEVIKALGKETEPGVAGAEQKVELWRYNSNLVFKPGEAVVSLWQIRTHHADGEDRTWTSLTRIARLFTLASSCANRRQGSNGTDGRSSSCSSLTTIVGLVVFTSRSLSEDVAVVMTKPKEKEGITKYNVTRRVCCSSLHALHRLIRRSQSR
jgi:hypothetical protein